MWAPNARRVRVVGDWSHWGTDDRCRDGSGTAGRHRHLVGRRARAVAGQRYKFEITGADGSVSLRADPVATCAEVPPGTASELYRSAYDWQRRGGRPGRSDGRTRNAGRMSVYEVHLGSWRRHPDGRPHSARELAEPLADWVAGLGFTHLELMPVATHPFGGSWGYQVSGYYAPDARLGSPDDLRHLIDVLPRPRPGRARGLGAGALPPRRVRARALRRHGALRARRPPTWMRTRTGAPSCSTTVAARCGTSWSPTRSTGSRSSTSTVCASTPSRRCSTWTTRGEPGEWVPNEHGGREDLEAIEFVRELTTVVGEEHPGAVVVAEESTSWPGVTAPVDWGGLGFGRKWNLGWMHDTLAYFERDPLHRAHHHGELTFPMVYARHERWVLPAQPRRGRARQGLAARQAAG